MIAYIIAVIVGINVALIAITIMHDISIFRLERKVDMLKTFIDVTMRQLENYALEQKASADQHTQDVGCVEGVEQTDLVEDSPSLVEDLVEDEPQTEEWYTYQDEQEYNDRWHTDCPWK